MKKIMATFIVVLSVAVMAAQKPCGEVFPNEGIKTTLGINGSRCIVSKIKAENDLGVSDMINKAMVSHDNSTIKWTSEGYVIYKGEKNRMDYVFDCEDVGAGRVFECKATNKTKGKTQTERVGLANLRNLFVGFSKTDIHYLFNGPALWEIEW